MATFDFSNFILGSPVTPGGGGTPGGGHVGGSFAGKDIIGTGVTKVGIGTGGKGKPTGLGIGGGGRGLLRRSQGSTKNTKAETGFKERLEFFYNPDDLRPDTAIGILLPFNKAVGGQSLTGNPTNPINSGAVYSTTADGSGVFRLSYTTEEQGISNLKMLLLTRKGERLYHPTFGTNVQALVFEPNTDELDERIAEELKASINFWLPYIVINDIFVDNTDSYGNREHRIEIKLRFRVTEQGANQEIILIVTGDTVNAIQ